MVNQSINFLAEAAGWGWKRGGSEGISEWWCWVRASVLGCCEIFGIFVGDVQVACMNEGMGGGNRAVTLREVV